MNSSGQRFEGSVEIDAELERAYALWADCENFHHFMSGVLAVHESGPNRLRWRAERWGEMCEWEAEITEQVRDSHISWRVLPDGQVRGTVTFTRGDSGGVRVVHVLEIPNVAPEERAIIAERISGDLRQFKSFVESHPD